MLACMSRESANGLVCSKQGKPPLSRVEKRESQSLLAGWIEMEGLVIIGECELVHDGGDSHSDANLFEARATHDGRRWRSQ